LVGLVTATTLLVVLAIPAFATHSFEITVDGTATLNEFKRVLTLTGTYTCTDPDGGIENDHSGFGGDEFVCDGTPQEWSADVQAHDANLGPGGLEARQSYRQWRRSGV